MIDVNIGRRVRITTKITDPNKQIWVDTRMDVQLGMFGTVLRKHHSSIYGDGYFILVDDKTDVFDFWYHVDCFEFLTCISEQQLF